MILGNKKEVSTLDPTEGQHHSSTEAKAAIDGLPDAYFLRLLRWTTGRIRTNSEASAEDVISAICLRFVDGTRTWPIGVRIEACFWEAVRSEISNAWDKHKRRLVRQAKPTVDEVGEEVDPVEELG